MGGFVTWANCCLKYADEQLRALGEGRQRRVVAHRADRLGAVARHRPDQQPQLLGRVAEGLLQPARARRAAAARPAAGAGRRGTACARRASAGRAGGAASTRLISPSRHDAAGVRVEHQHAARARGGRTRRSSAGSRSSTPTSDASTTSPSRRAHASGPGAGRCGRAWRPRCAPSVAITAAGPSHGSTSGRVVLVERAHLVVAGRASGRSRPAGSASPAAWGSERPPQHQQLEHRVELRGVRPALVGDREQLLQVAAEQLASAAAARAPRSQLPLPRTVLISPLWARKLNGCARSQVPSVLVEKREWTSASADAKSGVGEVGVEGVELPRAQQALVDDACATRGSMKVNAASSTPTALRRLLDAPADHVELALERLGVALAALDEQLADDGRGRARQRADRVRPHRHVAPAEGAVALLGEIRAHSSSQRSRTGRVARQEGHADAVVAGRRQLDRRAPRARRGAGTRRAAGSGCPAPSPVSGSEPVAPRWSRLRSTSTAWRDEAVRASCRPAARGRPVRRRHARAAGRRGHTTRAWDVHISKARTEWFRRRNGSESNGSSRFAQWLPDPPRARLLTRAGDVRVTAPQRAGLHDSAGVRAAPGRGPTPCWLHEHLRPRREPSGCPRCAGARPSLRGGARRCEPGRRVRRGLRRAARRARPRLPAVDLRRGAARPLARRPAGVRRRHPHPPVRQRRLRDGLHHRQLDRDPQRRGGRRALRAGRRPGGGLPRRAVPGGARPCAARHGGARSRRRGRAPAPGVDGRRAARARRRAARRRPRGDVADPPPGARLRGDRRRRRRPDAAGADGAGARRPAGARRRAGRARPPPLARHAERVAAHAARRRPRPLPRPLRRDRRDVRLRRVDRIRRARPRSRSSSGGAPVPGSACRSEAPRGWRATSSARRAAASRRWSSGSARR